MDLIKYLNDKKPIQVYIDDIDYGIMEYNGKLKRYENEYGNIPLHKIPLILKGDKNYGFIKIESVDNDNI